MSCRPNVLTAKCLSGKGPVGQTSVGLVSVGQMSVGQMSVGQTAANPPSPPDSITVVNLFICRDDILATTLNLRLRYVKY